MSSKSKYRCSTCVNVQITAVLPPVFSYIEPRKKPHNSWDSYESYIAHFIDDRFFHNGTNPDILRDSARFSLEKD